MAGDPPLPQAMTRPEKPALSSTFAALLSVCVLAAGCTEDPAVRAKRFFESGNRYYDQKKYREAAIEYRNAIQIEKASGAVRRRLAETYERLGDVERAREEYIRAADLIADDVSLQITAGSYLLAAKRYDEAKSRADRALNLKPGEVRAQVLLGNALAGLRDVDQALVEIEEAIRIDPTRGASYANLGIVQMSRGQFEGAERAFKRAVELSPDWIPAYLSLAHYYWATGKGSDAESTLRAALRLEPGNPVCNRAMSLFLISVGRARDAEPFVNRLAKSGAAPFALADFYLSQNRPGDAIPELQSLRNANKTASSASRRLAQAHALNGELETAAAIADELLQTNPRDAEGVLLKGQLLIQQGKREEAFAHFELAAKLDPNSSRAQFALGKAYAARGDVERARRAYNQVLALNPRAAEAQVALSRLALADGKVENSLRFAREAVRDAPSSLEARLSLVRGLLARGDIEGAEKVLAPLLRSAPEVSAVHVQRALVAMGRKDVAGARRSFERALELDADSIAALGGLVTLDTAAGHVAAAHDRIKARLERQPNRPDLLILAARASAAARDFDTAEAYLRRAIDAEPAGLAAYRMLGELYVKQGKLTEAHREFQQLAQRQNKPVAAMTMLGVIAQAQGDATQAEKHYERALTIDAAAPIAANNLAWLYAERGKNLEAALRLAQRASEALPGSPEVHDTLGWVHYKRQASDQAIAALRTTVELAPREATYQYHLGLAYAQNNEPQHARDALERALRLDKTFAQATEARRVLEELRAR